MPKLYYTSTSCGAGSFILAKAAGLNFEAEQVDLATHLTTVGKVDFYTINPKGNVPCLVLDDGTVLNENIATMTYIASLAENDALYPTDPAKRAKVLNALSYVASEWHTAIGALFNPTLSPAVKAFFVDRVAQKLTFINEKLLVDKFVAGRDMSIADIYLYITLTWTTYLGVDLKPYPVVSKYVEKMAVEPIIISAQEVMATDPTNTSPLGCFCF